MVHLIGKNKGLRKLFSSVQINCLPNENAYRLSMKVVAYKKPSKMKKYISLVGLGIEKITIALKLINLNTNKTLAQREIESEEISKQLTSYNSKSDFIKSVKLFLNVAID